MKMARCATGHVCNWQHVQQTTCATGNTCNWHHVQLDRSAGRTSWTNQLDGPVLFTWSLGQFAYSKIGLSVCTLSQLPSPTKALFFLTRPLLMDWNKAIVVFLSEILAMNDDTVVYLYFLIIVIQVTCSDRIIAIITFISNILNGGKSSWIKSKGVN